MLLFYVSFDPDLRNQASIGKKKDIEKKRLTVKLIAQQEQSTMSISLLYMENFVSIEIIAFST
jgi:hypothetical protein